MGTFIIVNEYLENLKSLYDEFKTAQTNLKEVEIIPNVQELLENRYFVNLFNGKETKYEQLCRRVSRVIAATEISHAHLNTDIEMDDNDLLLTQIRNIEKSIYTDMINGNFLFNSPCLFSAGTGFSATENGHLLYDDEITLDDYRKIYENSHNKNQMLFACFVIGIEDSIEGIFDAVKKCAIISKAGGGVGLNFSPLREKNAKIRDNEGLASGVVSFAGDFNAMGDSIRQGGKRRVALMGMLNSNHPDIEEFINCKTEEGKLTNFNISVAIDDKFMEAIQNDSDYDLISSVDGHIVKTVKARELWNNICESAHRRGDPGIFFIDLTNKDSLLKNDEDYYINSTNPSLIAGTKVLTNNGIFNIEELEDKKFTVPSLINDSSDAVCFMSGENKHVNKIIFRNKFEVTATDEHKWVVLRNDELVKVKTSELKIGDYVPKTKFRKSLNFGTIGDREDGFLIGWLYGNGSINTLKENNKKQYDFTFSEEEYNQGICEKIVNKISSITGNSHDPSKRERNNSTWYELHTKNNAVHEYMSKFGVNTKDCGIPSSIWGIATDDFRIGFIDGLFSADSHIETSRGRIQLTSKYDKFIDDIIMLLGFYGITGMKMVQNTTSKFPNGKDYGKIYHRNDLKLNKYNSLLFRELVGSLTQLRKDDDLQNISDITKPDKYKDYLQIIDVQDNGIAEKVWDLRVNDESHSFYLGSVLTGNCSTGDTLVSTPNGWKRADSFSVGDEIITVNGVEKIQDIEINNDIDVYQVDFADGGSVKVTPSHQFMWVNKQNSNITEFRQLKDLQVGDYIKICPSSIPDNHNINTFGLSEFDYGLILGTLFGDGCITETSIKASSVRVSFGKQDTQWQQYFENILTKYTIQYHVNEKRTAFDVVFNKGTVIYDIINDIGLVGYSYNKRIPIEIINSNKEILSGLLNGYFSTDGNVNLGSTRPQIRLTSCNLELLQDVRLILLMFGISCTVHTTVRDHSVIEGRLVNSRNKYTLILNSISLITFLENIGLKHQGKLEKLNSCFENYKPMNHRWRTTIKNIAYIGKEKVYDLHAPKSDTWLTNGYVSRGCGEQPLPNFTSCNLGSINLVNFVTNDNKFDFDEFIKMVRRGIYYLDLVIDTSSYPLPEIEERTKAIRPVGLGLMGLADMFIKLCIKYGSEESNKLSEQIAQIMAAQSLYESVKLAEIKGSFEQFDKEPQQKLLMTMYNEMVINYGIESTNNNIAIQYIKDIIDGNIKSILPISIANAFYSLYQYNKEDFYKIFHKFEDGYLRNSRRLNTAPTGTISMILNTSSSLEPNFAFEWKRNITNSNGTVETKIFKHKYADIENKELLVTANELTPDEHVNIVKAFAPYIDASISKCVAKGTKIYTNKGFINIEDFGNPDKEIDTFEDISDKNIYVRDMFGHWKKVLSHYRGGMKDTYIITFKDGFSIECSSTHKFECRDIITRYTGNHNPYSEVVSIWLSASNLYEDFKNNKKIEILCQPIDENERITPNPFINVIKSAYNSNDNSGELRCISYIREIQNITKSTNEVYDIEVEDTHTYLIDGVISHNTVNMPNNATVEDVKKVYENCYNNGIKGITIYRDMSREGQTLQKIDNTEKSNNKTEEKY